MEWLGTLVGVVLWFVGVPVIVFGALKVAGYDWHKPWLMWRTEAGPLPVWVYLGVSVFLGVGVVIAALAR